MGIFHIGEMDLRLIIVTQYTAELTSCPYGKREMSEKNYAFVVNVRIILDAVEASDCDDPTIAEYSST